MTDITAKSIVLIPVSRMASTGLSTGLVAGALFGLLDVVTSPASPPPSTVVLLVLLAAAACTVITFPICMAVYVVRSLIARRLSERMLLAGLWGVAIQIPLMSTLSGTRGLMGATCPWIVAWLILRKTDKSYISHQLPRSIAITALFTLAAAAYMWCGTIEFEYKSFLLAACGLGVATVGVTRLAEHRPAAVLGTFAVALALIGLFARAGGEWVGNGLPRAMPSSQPAAAKPNVVVIVLDTTRADYLGCYGNKLGLTPRLDALAAESTVYLNTFTTGPWTLPSHASLFTGYYTPTHGCDNEPHRWLDDGFLTLPEMLAPHGYQSAALVANNYVEEGNLLQGFDRYLMLAAGRKGSRLFTWIRRLGLPSAWADHGAADGRDALQQWLSHARAPSKPICLFINLLETHWPHNPPLPERLGHLPVGVSYREALDVSERYYGIRWLAGQRHSVRDEKILRALYAGEVAYQDRVLGEMIDVLRSRLDLNKTVLVVTADHGENLGEGGRWDHMFALNDALVHVPLIIRYPGGVGRGEQVAGLNQLVDIVPTVFDLLGTQAPVHDLPGRSLLPSHFMPREYVFAQATPYYGHLERMESVRGFQVDVHDFTAHLQSIRDDRYKLVYSSHGEWRLFDTQDDPMEVKNIADSQVGLVKLLRSKLEAWTAAQPPYVPRPGENHRPRRAGRNSLRDIGYIQ